MDSNRSKTKAIEINPDYVEAYFKRANTYELLLDNYQKAIDDYTKVIELKPDDGGTYFSHGYYYDDAEAYNALGHIYC